MANREKLELFFSSPSYFLKLCETATGASVRRSEREGLVWSSLERAKALLDLCWTAGNPVFGMTMALKFEGAVDDENGRRSCTDPTSWYFEVSVAFVMMIMLVVIINNEKCLWRPKDSTVENVFAS